MTTKNIQIMEKAVKYLKDNAVKDNGLFCYEIVHEALEMAIIDAKKQVFSDIEDGISVTTTDGYETDEYRRLKKRHLQTFAKAKAT